jgi:hypothetical protein
MCAFRRHAVSKGRISAWLDRCNEGIRLRVDPMTTETVPTPELTTVGHTANPGRPELLPGQIEKTVVELVMRAHNEIWPEILYPFLKAVTRNNPLRIAVHIGALKELVVGMVRDRKDSLNAIVKADPESI